MALEDGALATVAQVQARLWEVLDDASTREVNGAIIDLSHQARDIGLSTWTTPANTPLAVLNLIVRAAARHAKFYEGLVRSEAGDEKLQWNENRTGSAGSATFTDAEIAAIKAHAGARTGVVSVNTFAWSDKPAAAELTDHRCEHGTNTDYYPTESGTLFPWGVIEE